MVALPWTLRLEPFGVDCTEVGLIVSSALTGFVREVFLGYVAPLRAGLALPVFDAWFWRRSCR